MVQNPVPRSAQKYKNAQGIEVEDYTTAKKWLLRLAFYVVYYTLIYLLYLYSINKITSYTHANGMKKPITQGRLGSPRMTLFPMDQIREIDWIPRSGVDNHLWYDDKDYGNGVSMRQAYKELLEKKMYSMKNATMATDILSFCGHDYIHFENGKACFIVGVNTVVDWKPVKLNLTTENNWFNVKFDPKDELDEKEPSWKQFDLASQGLTENSDADIYFQCRVFETQYNENSKISKPLSLNPGKIVSSGIEWMKGENFIKNYNAFSGGVNPKYDKENPDADKYEDCFQPSFSAADCNINEFDYKTWDKPITAVKIDMAQIASEFNSTNAVEGTRGYEFKCNAYAQNIIAPIYVEEENVYYEGDNGQPVVQSGGRDLHQNFIIQF